MPLFRRKKKVKEEPKIPSFESLSKKSNVEKLPEIKFSGEELDFPEYEKDLGGIKKAVSDEKRDYEPLFRNKEFDEGPIFEEGPKLGDLDVPEVIKPRKMTKPIKLPKKSIKPFRLEKPTRLEEKMPRVEEPFMKKEDVIKEPGFEKPIFVKIDQYKKMISTIEGIQDKLDDAAKLVSEIKSIKLEEDHLLDAWHSNIERIKNDLVRIDKRVFES